MKLRFLIDSLIIILFTGFVAYFTNKAGYVALWGDGYAHATKIKFLVDFWPNINWVYFWGNGIPVFLWYGFIPYAFLVLFFKIFSAAALAITALNLMTFVIIGIGIYGIVYEVTKSRPASLLAAFLTIPLPGLWYRVLVGTTTRTFGDAFLVLSLWFLIKALKEERVDSLKFATFWGLTIFTSLAFQAHFFTALLTVFFDFIVIFVVAKGFSKKVKFLFLTFFLSFLLAFYFLVPFILTKYLTPVSSSFGIFAVDPLDLRLLFYHPPESVIIPGGGLLPIHLPLLIIFLPIIFLSGKLKDRPFTKRIIFAFLTLFVFFITFGVATYFGYPATWYSTAFVPDEAFEFLSIVIPVMLGILLWLTFSKKWLKYASLAIFSALVVLVFWQYPSRGPLRAQVLPKEDSHRVYDESLIWKLLEGQEEEKNYRYAHPATEISLWFNFDSQIPQNREFFPHGVVYPNWRSWQENAIWNPQWNEKVEETKFLLDWFAIRWFSLIPNFNQNKEKYQKDVDFEIKVANQDESELGFEYKTATPILSTTNAPAFLVVGEREQDRSFGPIIRLLATENLNSQVVIAVRGKSFLDDYRQEELAKFPLIFLYEYRLKNPQKGGKIIKDYLEQGGKVFIESTSFLDENQREIFEERLGFKSSLFQAKEEKWNFSPGKSDLTKKIDFSKFSPPLFEGSAWKFQGVEEVSLNEGQEALLGNEGKVVIFRQKVGQGELIWSGLNLPYHALSYNNQEESQFLFNIIFDLLESQPRILEQPKSAAKFINPQERKVEILELANGVLFKENYFFNWRAVWQSGDQRRTLRVYPAGLDFMYIPLDKNQSGGQVTIFYRRSLMEQASTAISLFSLIVLVGLWIGYLKVGPAGFRNYLSILEGKSVGRLTRWWHRENEE